jgi:MFS family permease
VPILSSFTSIINSYLLILFATLGTTFQSEYEFSPLGSGLAYLGLLVGFVLSEIGIGLLSDAVFMRQADPLPESRLPLLILGACFLPGVLLMYGWTIEAHVYWMAPIVASGLVAAASMCSYIPVQTYFIDVYTLHAASAMGAASIVRSIISSVTPLGAEPLYNHLGYGWGFTLLAGIALLFVVGAIYLVKRGESLRKLDGEIK